MRGVTRAWARARAHPLAGGGTAVLVFAVASLALFGCALSSPYGGDGEGGRPPGDQPSPGAPARECEDDSDCVLACAPSCCSCPVVRPRAEAAEGAYLVPSSPWECAIACVEDCPSCPRPGPEPRCIDGTCLPDEGCAEDADCALARDCRCGCVLAVPRAELLRDPCLAPPGSGEEACAACPASAEPCSACSPPPVGAICGRGSCIPDHGNGAHLSPCGGAMGRCPVGYTCFPGDRDCGFGNTGVCLPADRPPCVIWSGTPCSQMVEDCLPLSFCPACAGACLLPSEEAHVCAVAPACFLCD